MLGTQHYLVFVASGILLNIMPGQDTLYIASRSIAQGKRAGILSVFGVCSGALIHNILVAFGLAVVLKTSIFAYNLIKYLGAVYFLYLGVSFIRSNKFLGDSTDLKKAGDLQIYIQGLLTDLLNPKVSLFFLAFLPQFVNPVNNYGAFSFLFLGCTFIFTGFLWCLCVAVYSSKIASFIGKNPENARIINLIFGLIFIGLAVIAICH
jgi:threonine/homoserine/homoserine lactone efflux protein